MSRVTIPVISVGDEFVLIQPRLQMAVPAVTPQPATALPIAPALPFLQQPREFTPSAETSPTPIRPPVRLLNFLHRHSLVAFALLFLLVGITATEVAGSYQAAHIEAAAKPALALKTTVPAIAGLNLTVPSDQLQAKLQTITSQPVTLTVGTQSMPISSDSIKSWLQITSNTNKSEYYIRIKAGTITASLNQLANQFVKAPSNQVTVNEDGVSQIVVGGRNGTALSDPNSLKTQADQIAKTVMGGKGLQFTTPLQTVPFQSVTPVAFDKLLVVNVTTKKMWAFQNGQQVNNWLVSAGKPSTPTPLGEFHIYAKFSVQDMRGTNPNGTPYFQPHVHWVNYFSGGSAIHGVYWHPLSWFGVNNSSHGCVGVPDDQAEWIYNWAPIGTTVITHA
jgi:lipoprotein-anchoring transpeptidase ErfK/SrfK